MKTKKTFSVLFLFCLFVGVWSLPAYSDIQQQLVGQVWKKERANTFKGDLTTLWMFFEDGTGIAYQRFNRNGSIKTLNHRFTYIIEQNRVTIQEEIDKEWEGLYGVTHWTLQQNQLIGDVKLGKNQLVYTPVQI